MRDLMFRRFVRYASVILALAIADAAVPDTAGAQETTRTTTERYGEKGGRDFGWIGLLGLAGLLGLRKRDEHHQHRDVDTTNTTRRP